MESLDGRFPRYERFDPAVPVWCVTPGEGRCIHRFFDASPMSPSGRYVAVLRLPFEDRMPAPGDAAQVVLVDLDAGEEKVVATTRGWEPQMGANLNWGGDDHTLVFNDVDTQAWTPRLVVLDPLTGKRRETDGGVYHVSPDGRRAAAASMDRMRRTQFGYGVLVPDDRVPRNLGARDDAQPTRSLRVDPHPAWDRTWRWVAFNGVGEDNTRRVFLADLQLLLDA